MAKANLANEKFFLRLIHQGKLKVTRSGRAFNLSTGKEIAIGTSSAGYRKLSWQDPKTKRIRQIQLHRIVWAHFKGVLTDPDLQLNHKDGVKANCSLKNLEVTDNVGNANHAVRIGLHAEPRGENRCNSKFLDEEVRKLRREFALYECTHYDLSEEYGVHPLTMEGMLSGSTYDHIVTRYDTACKKLLRRVGRGFKRY